MPSARRLSIWSRATGASTRAISSRQVTHLIVHKPEGKKYQAARDWGIQTVSLEWLQQTCERGLVLEEALFNPLKPPEERGVGAWSRTAPKRNSLGKRLRNDPASTTEDGQRKLRKTASLRLGHQTKTMWDDIPTPETSLVDTEPLPTKVQGQLPRPPARCAALLPSLRFPTQTMAYFPRHIFAWLDSIRRTPTF